MCTPLMAVQGIAAAVSVGLGLEQNRINVKNAKKTMEYKTQIAINNANAARTEALRQQQLGINESRKEKISAMQKVSIETAKNSANGFDVNSDTNMQNYRDIIDNSNANAQNIKDNYNLKADSYFNKANEYMGQISGYKNDYNSTLYKNAMNSLGTVRNVASKWYSNTED